VGINTPLRLCELLEERDAAPQKLVDMAGAWEKAFKAYESREFLPAKNTFAAILQKDETDRVARLYQKRCEEYLAAPPSVAAWDDGVDNLTEK
jgi:hypothetical protein